MLDSIFDHPSLLRILGNYGARVGWTFYHTLWQGLVVAGLLSLGLRLVSRRLRTDANARYLLSLVALLSMPFLALFTFLCLEPGIGSMPNGGHRFVVQAMFYHFTQSGVANLELSSHVRSWMEPWLPMLSIFWIVGASLAALRLVLGWTLTRKLVAKATRAEDGWQQKVDRLREAMSIPYPVRILFSDAISTPSLVGWIHPVILWPVSAFTGMSPLAINALLAHELAHVRRHDFFVNVIQSSVDALFFYHPAIWWISRQIRLEREHCADDLSVSLLEESGMGTRVTYAQSLLILENVRSEHALSIPANGGHLLQRVRRLAGVKSTRTSPAKPLAGLVVIGLLSAMICSIHMSVQPLMAGAVQEKPTEFRRIDSMESSVAKPPANEANLVTEPIAQAIVARLAARPIEPDALATIRDRMWQALREGKPLFLGQVHALLGEFGYDLETLHGSLEPTRPPELVSNPNLVTEEIAQAIISRLSARSIAPEALSAVRDGMWQAIREGKPLALEQVHELLAQFGYNPQTLHERPESAH